MKPYRVESVETWRKWKARIVSVGYLLWQTAYGWNLPEGYVVGFINPAGKRFEIVTHSKEIAEDITHSNL